jgi:hypothetical protein
MKSPLQLLVGVVLIASFAACGGGSSTAPAMPAANPNPTFTPLPPLQGSPLALTSVTVTGPEETVIAPGPANLHDTPDEHMPYLRQPDGSFKLWASAGGVNGTDLFRTSDLGMPGTPTQVFAPAGAGTTAFDADYAGPGSIFAASNGTDLLMIYHAENHLFNGTDVPGTPFYATIGLARSSDGGVTWQRQGAIITAHDPQQQTQTVPGAGALTPTAIEVGGFIYVMFREIDPQTGTSGLALARAPIASDAAPGSWQKYNSGSYSTAGLGGTFTPIQLTLDPAVPGDIRQPQLSFNTYLNSYVLTAVGNGGIYLATSSDLLNWSNGIVAVPAPEPDATAGVNNGPRNWYPTFISTNEPSDQITSQTGFVYYAKFLGDGTSFHYMYRRPVSLVH